MKKIVKIGWKVLLVLIIICGLLVVGSVYSKRDELVTRKITMKYFEKVVNNNDKENIKTFIANSNNDVLYSNFVNTLDNQYYFEGVSDFDFNIKNVEMFGNGKYQCYFANAFENHTPKCDLENEGRYMNYLVDIEISYNLKEKEIKQKEKGLVVFVKDMEEGNYFTWKLVRFDRYRVEG